MVKRETRTLLEDTGETLMKDLMQDIPRLLGASANAVRNAVKELKQEPTSGTIELSAAGVAIDVISGNYKVEGTANAGRLIPEHLEIIRALLGGLQGYQPDANGWLSAEYIAEIVPSTKGRKGFPEVSLFHSKSIHRESSRWKVESNYHARRPRGGGAEWRLVAEVDGEWRPLIGLVDDLGEVLERWNGYRATSRAVTSRSGAGGELAWLAGLTAPGRGVWLSGARRLRVVPAAAGGRGLLDAVVVSAQRHPGFADHAGLAALGGQDTAELALGLAETLTASVDTGDVTLAGLLARSGLSAGQARAALLGEAGWDEPAAGVMAWLVARRFGVGVRTVGTDGESSQLSRGAGEREVEVVVAREPAAGGDGYSGTEPVQRSAPRPADSGRLTDDGDGHGADLIDRLLQPPPGQQVLTWMGPSEELEVVRHVFSRATDEVMPRQFVIHRRHIVPSHAFRIALNAWLNQHFPGDHPQRRLVHALLQAWQDALDNYVPNLWLGPGVDNVAAGGLWRTLEVAGPQIANENLSGADAAQVVDQVLEAARNDYSAKVFHPWRQKLLAGPVLDALRATSAQGAGVFNPAQTANLVADMSASADFDWPGGEPEQFEEWLRYYWAFRMIAAKPEDYSAQDLRQVLEGFLLLQPPDSRFDPDLLDDSSTSSDSADRSSDDSATSFGDAELVVSGSRVRPDSARVVFDQDLRRQAEEFAEGRSESFDETAGPILTELFFGSGDEVVARLTGHPAATIAAYRARFLAGEAAPSEAAGPGNAGVAAVSPRVSYVGPARRGTKRRRIADRADDEPAKKLRKYTPEEGWSRSPASGAIRGQGSVTEKGVLSVARQTFVIGRELDGELTKSRVTYWVTQNRLWVEWPDGRRIDRAIRIPDDVWERKRRNARGAVKALERAQARTRANIPLLDRPEARAAFEEWLNQAATGGTGKRPKPLIKWLEDRNIRTRRGLGPAILPDVWVVIQEAWQRLSAHPDPRTHQLPAFMQLTRLIGVDPKALRNKGLRAEPKPGDWIEVDDPDVTMAVREASSSALSSVPSSRPSAASPAEPGTLKRSRSVGGEQERQAKRIRLGQPAETVDSPEFAGSPEPGAGAGWASAAGSSAEDPDFEDDSVIDPDAYFPGQDLDDDYVPGEDEGSGGEDTSGGEPSEQWRLANPWWTPDSGPRTREGGIYSPTDRQRSYLNSYGLRVLWVTADGDCMFSAAVQTVGQDRIRTLIGQAAQRSGIEVPDEADVIGWLLGQAALRAGRNLPAPGLSDQVTGPHLRLFLAWLLERDTEWNATLFAPDDTEEAGPGEIVFTRRGMVAQVRELTTYAEGVANAFPQLIAHFLNIDLQVLDENGALSGDLGPGRATSAGGADYVFVLRQEHYLATRPRLSEPPATGSPVAGSAAVVPLAAEGLRRVVAEVRALVLARGAVEDDAAEGDAESLELCVGVVSGVLRRLHPGLRVARAVDDAAAGLGGVAGVRERLVPGGGWARAASWPGLEQAVRDAGPGASAVVLVSLGGGRLGHALLLHHAAEGVVWVDPAQAADRVASAVARPGVLGGVLAGWAVLVGADGRVAEPGGWAAAESATVVGVLADAPVRHDFGAMGVEIERYNVRLLLRDGQNLPEKAVLVRSSDGLVKIVVDFRNVWVGADGVLYDSEEHLAAAGVAGHPQAGPGGMMPISVPEIVTAPWTFRAEPGRPSLSEVKERVADVDRRWLLASETRSATPQNSRSLADLFPEPDYVVSPELADAEAVRYPGLAVGRPLLVQQSVGVPLGGGVLAVLEQAERVGESGKSVLAAMRFGWQVARLYVAGPAGTALAVENLAALTLDWDVVRVFEVMALAFIQLSGVLRYLATARQSMKAWMPVVPRQSLYEIWGELGPELQQFLEEQAHDIRGLFAAEFQASFSSARRLNPSDGDPDGTRLNLWDTVFSDEYTGIPIGTVGQLFDEILRPAPEGPRIGPEVFDVGPADFGAGLDRSSGSGLPLVVLEMRVYGRSNIAEWQLDGIIEELADVAGWGEDAAAFARYLPGSPEGQGVLTAVRSAVAAPAEAGRDRAAEVLRQAVDSYLARFPLQRLDLDEALRPAAARLGLPDLAQADDAEIESVARMEALLGAGHQIRQIRRVVLLARDLGMPAGGEAPWLAGLARDVGLQDQDPGQERELTGTEVTRLFGLLKLASAVFYDGGADLQGLARLLRLTESIRAAGRATGPEVGVGDLRHEYRRRHGLDAGAPVTTRQLRELVDLPPGDGPATGLIPAAGGQPGRRRVRWAGPLPALGGTGQRSAAAEPRLTTEDVTMDVSGPVGGGAEAALRRAVVQTRRQLRPSGPGSSAVPAAGRPGAGTGGPSASAVAQPVSVEVAAAWIFDGLDERARALMPQERAVETLAAVLALARGQRFGPQHDDQVAAGLGLLPWTRAELAVSSWMPSIYASRLTVGQVFGVGGPFTGRAMSEGEGERAGTFVIAGPRARDILDPGGSPGQVMFGPGARFRVRDITARPDGSRLVWLDHDDALGAGGSVVLRLRGGYTSDPWSLADCVSTVRGWLRSGYPGGLRLAGSADDSVAGLGGVAGVRARLVAGPGWARVASWQQLEKAVADAGNGARAVVLLSFAGDRQGHALMLRATGAGLVWADPNGGAVTEDRPGMVDQAVAAWAVLIGPAGQVMGVPGGWAAPESAGGAGVLADAPVRHDFGAMGVEIERHNVRLFLPSGSQVQVGEWLVRSPDLLVTVVVDSGVVWVSEEGNLYDSVAAMDAAGVAPDPLAPRPGGRTFVSVPEIVTVPWRVLDEWRPDLEEVLERIREVDAYWDRAPADLNRVPEGGTSLAELFEGSGYEVNPDAGDVRVVRLAGLSEGAPLYVQPSVGVPLGGGVLVAMTGLLRGMQASPWHQPMLRAALSFGWRIAHGYAEVTAQTDGDAEWLTPVLDVAEVIAIAEVMALAFTQVSGLLGFITQPELRGVKNWMTVVARQDLADIYAELGPWPKAFLAAHPDVVWALFADEFGDLYPGFAGRYNAARGRPADTPVELRGVDFYGQFTMGQLLDQVLRPTTEDERIGQRTFVIGGADSGGLDRSGPDLAPLVVLEMRYLNRSKFGPGERPEVQGKVDYPLMVEIIRELAGSARQGAAAAEFARALPRSTEGRLMAAWLRQAVLAPEGADRDRAVRLLRQAAAWYLDRFPSELEPLEVMLGSLADGLGLPGMFGTSSLAGSLSELPPGPWEQAVNRYEAAYDAVSGMAPTLALPRSALRGLVGELAGLGAGVGEFLPEMLRDGEVLRPLRGIGEAMPVRGGAELAILVNDLLAAASLVPGSQTPAGVLFSSARLADLLRQISEALGEGRDPLTAPALADTGYRADEPLAVRMARLGLLNASDQAPEWAAAAVEETPSGWYVRPGNADGTWDEELDRAAALLFPPMRDAVAVHVHTDRETGLLAVEGDLLTAEDFYAGVLAPLAAEGGMPAAGGLVVMVACGVGATGHGEAKPAAGVLARLGGWRVLAASADVFTLADGRVVTASAGFGGDGRPVVGAGAGAVSWRLFEPAAEQPTEFGQADLAGVLARVTRPGEAEPPAAPADPVALADPVPADAVRWALGLEAERHDIVLFRSDGQELPEKTVLLHSRDKLVKVVVDNGTVWAGRNGVLYESAQAMKAALVQAEPDAHQGGRVMVAIPEAVTVPWAAGAELGRADPAEVKARILDIDRQWGQVPDTVLSTFEGSVSLADLFPDKDYLLTSEGKGVRALRLGGPFADAPLYVQLSAGVPLGGGVMTAVKEVQDSLDHGDSGVEVLGAAMRFGWLVAAGYVDVAGVGALAPDWDVTDVVSVAEAMSLAFLQLTGVLMYQSTLKSLMKSWMLVTPRHSLHDIRAELPPGLRAFFSTSRDVIRKWFADEFLALDPDFAKRYNTSAKRSAGDPVVLLDVPFYDEYMKRHLGTVGQLLDEVLRPEPGVERIGPEVFDIARADSGGLDRSGGSGPGDPLPLVVLELRAFGQAKYRDRPGRREHIDYPMMISRIERVTGLAQRGVAAAEVARRLRDRAEGQAVTAWLRQAVAAAEGEARDGLRAAVAEYLASYPGDVAALKTTLEVFAGRLPGLDWADAGGWAAVGSVLARAGYQVAGPELIVVTGLARGLGMPADGAGQWLEDLAGRVGVRGAGPVPRLVRLLVLAAAVFDDGGVSLEDVAALRRLADRIRRAAGAGTADVGLGELAAEYRGLFGLGAAVPVSMAQLRELVTLVRRLGVKVQQIELVARARQVVRESLARDPATLRLAAAARQVNRDGRTDGGIWLAALDFLRDEPAVAGQVRFVEDAWREDGRPWNLIPVPAGIRELLRVGGRTVVAGDAAGRRANAGTRRRLEPEVVAVRFAEGRSGVGDVPESLELAALARGLAEAGADAPDAGQLPRAGITGYGNGRFYDRSGESARQTGQRRAEAVRARLLDLVRRYLGELGADPGIAEAMLPAGQVVGASGRDLLTREAAREVEVTVQAARGVGGRVAGSAGAAAGMLSPGVLGDGVVYAGAGGVVAAGDLAVAEEFLGLLEGVNPLRGLGGEFATNCVLTAFAVDLALREGEGFRAGAAGLLPVADVERFAGGSLGVADGYGAVAEVVRAAGEGARGIVLAGAPGQDSDHAFNVVNVNGRVVFLDGQAGGLAELPAALEVRLVLTAGDVAAGWGAVTAAARPAAGAAVLAGGGSGPRRSLSRGEEIAGLLRAEREARLALNLAARLGPHPDGWRERGLQAVAAAMAATDRAMADRPGDSERDAGVIGLRFVFAGEEMADRPGDSMLDAGLLVGLRAAVGFWREHGHLEVPVNSSEVLTGMKTTLGAWLARARTGKPGAKQARTTNLRFAREPLNVLGMRWDARAGGRPPGDLGALADEVRAADNARLDGDAARLDAAIGRIKKILGDFDQLERTLLEARDLRMLLAAFDRWERYGTLEPRPGDRAGELLDRWVEGIRLANGGIAALPWLRAVLGAFGMVWDIPPDGPDADTDPGLPPAPVRSPGPGGYSPVEVPGWPDDLDWQLAEPGLRGDPDVPMPGDLVQDRIPGPPGLDGGQRDALAGLGLAEELVGADGDCLMNALLISAPEVFSGWDAAGLREYLAWFLDDQIGRNGPAWQEMKVNALWSLAMDQAAREPNLPQSEVDRYVADYSVNPPAGWQADLVQGLARVGEWGHVSADLAPALAAAAFDLGLMIVYPGGGVQPFRDGGHRAVLVRVPGHWHGTRPLGDGPAAAAGSGLSLSRGEEIAGRLRAEREARLALNRAARLGPHPDGWREQGRQAVADAGAATDRAMADRPGDSERDAGLLVGLRAAVRFWREHRHLEVPVSSSEVLARKMAVLGGSFAREPLNVLGMQWDAEATSGGVPPGSLGDLAGLVRSADNARLLDGGAAYLNAAIGLIHDILGDVGPLERALPQERDRDMVRAAFDRWERYGTLEPQPRDIAGELDWWLAGIRRGLAAGPSLSWLRAVLGVLGMVWDVPPDGPEVGTDPGLRPSGYSRRGAPGVPMPGEASDRAQLAVLLDAERDAWLSRDTAALLRARQATDRALVPLPADTNADIRLLNNLRAAISFWRQNGHLEIPKDWSASLPGETEAQGGTARPESLKVGTWILNIRQGTGVSWARPALDVLGMRWQSHRGGRVWLEAAGLLREQDEALRRGSAAAAAGLTADAAQAARAADTAGLDADRKLKSFGGTDGVRLRDAVARWRRTGSLDLPPDSEPEELDGWLESVLAGEISPGARIQAVLGVLGIRWRPARAPQDGRTGGRTRFVARPSGVQFLADGVPGVRGDDADSEAAAAWFPALDNAMVVHLHTDPRTGNPVVGDRVLTPEQFYGQLTAAGLWPPETLLVLVACGAAAQATAGAESVAQALARLGGRPVLAPDTGAWTTPDGQVLAAETAYDHDGRPGYVSGNWVLVSSGGQRSAQLGHDLLKVLTDENRYLAGLLAVEGVAAPVVAGQPDSQRPRHSVRWSGAGRSAAGQSGLPRFADLPQGLVFTSLRRSLVPSVQLRNDLRYLEVEMTVDGSQFVVAAPNGQGYLPADFARLVRDQVPGFGTGTDVLLVAHHHPARSADQSYAVAFSRAVAGLAGHLGVVIHASGTANLRLRPAAGTGPPLWVGSGIIQTFPPGWASGAAILPLLRHNGHGGLVPVDGPVNDPAGGRVLASVTPERAEHMRERYQAAEVAGVLDLDLEVLADGALAAVYRDGTISFLTPPEFQHWLVQAGRRFGGQVLRLLAAPPLSEEARERFIDQVRNAARLARVDIYYPAGEPRVGGDNELFAEGGWQAALGSPYRPAAGWFTSDQEGRLVPGSERAEIRLDGGYAFVSYATYLGLFSWLGRQRRVPGLFDLVLESVDDGSGIGRWLSDGGNAGGGDVIRLRGGDPALVMDRLGELASSRGRHVLMREGGVWRVIWPAGSWEGGQGRELVRRAVRLPGLFVVGLHLVPGTGLITLYDRDSRGDAGTPQDLARWLRRAGWRRGQPIVAVTSRTDGDGLARRLRALSAALGSEIWYPSPVAGQASVPWLIVHPHQDIPAQDLPSPLEGRPDGTIGVLAESVVTRGGAIYFPGTANHLDLGLIAARVPAHPALVTVVVNVASDGFETLRADGTASVLDAGAFAARLTPRLPGGGSDLRIVWRVDNSGGVTADEDFLMRRLASELQRVLWLPGPGVTEHDDDLMIRREDATSVAWQPIVPVRADGTEVPANNVIDLSGYLVPSAGLVYEAFQPGTVHSVTRRWAKRFGPAVAAASLYPGQFILGLDVGRGGSLSFSYGGGFFATAAPADIADLLQRHGWRGETLLVVTERRPMDRVDEQLDRLADYLQTDIHVLGAGATLGDAGGRLQARDEQGRPANLWIEHQSRSLRQDGIDVPSWFVQLGGVIRPGDGIVEIRFRQGFASMGVTGYLSNRDLLARVPEPGLFDLWLMPNARGELGFADYRGRFAQAYSDDLPTLPDGMHEVRLIVDDGARFHAEAAELATHYSVPVWVTPDGAGVDLAGSRLIARRRDSQEPVAWVQVMPSGQPDPERPWYDTSSGLFEPRPEDAVIVLRRPGGEAYAMLAPSHQDYYHTLATASSAPRVPDGMYVVSAEIDPVALTFSRHRSSGEPSRSPLAALPGILADHGWAEHLAIVIMPRYPRLHGEVEDFMVTSAYAEIALETGVTVYFPEAGSQATWLYGDLEPAVRPSGAAGPAGGWAFRLPAGQPAHPRFVPDLAGRLRAGDRTGAVSLIMSHRVRTGAVTLRAGVASPAVPGRGQAYEHARSDPDLSVFFVDVPLADDGRIALVTSAPADISPASTGEVLALIEGGGYRGESQVLQFLAAPPTPEAYAAFVDEVRRIADALRRSAFIVAGPGATVEYDERTFAFVARRGDAVVQWREIPPSPLAGILGGRAAQVDNGVIVVGNLAGELAAYVRNGTHRADVITIAASGQSWLEGVTAGQLDQVLSSLGFGNDPVRPVRLVWEPVPEPDAGSAEGLAGLLTALAVARGTAVYLGAEAWYHQGARDLAASWQRYGPKRPAWCPMRLLACCSRRAATNPRPASSRARRHRPATTSRTDSGHWSWRTLVPS